MFSWYFTLKFFNLIFPIAQTNSPVPRSLVSGKRNLAFSIFQLNLNYFFGPVAVRVIESPLYIYFGVKLCSHY